MAGTEVMSPKERWKYAEALAQARTVPPEYQSNAANVFYAVEFGIAMGIAPVVAMNEINIIEGRPTPSALTMAALVKRAGYLMRFKEEGRGRDAVVAVTVIDPRDPEGAYTSTWDWKRAEAEGFTQSRTGVKSNWAHHPVAMMRARAITEACRVVAPDVVLGFEYDPDELGVEYNPLGTSARATVDPVQDAYEQDEATQVAVVELVQDEPEEQEAYAEPGEDAEVVTETGSGSDADARRLEAVAAIYEQADADGYEPERLAAAVAWASGQRTQLVEELEADEAEKLLAQMRAMSDEGGEQA